MVRLDTTPRDVIPRDVIPRDTTPRDVIPRDTTPRYVIPRDYNQTNMEHGGVVVRFVDVWHGGGGTMPQRARVATGYNQGCGVLRSKQVGKRKGGDLGMVSGVRSLGQPEYR